MVDWLTANHGWIWLIIIPCAVWVLRKPRKKQHSTSVSNMISSGDLPTPNIMSNKPSGFSGGSGGGAGNTRSFASTSSANYTNTASVNPTLLAPTSTEIPVITTVAETAENTGLLNGMTEAANETISSTVEIAGDSGLLTESAEAASEIIDSTAEGITEIAGEVITNILN